MIGVLFLMLATVLAVAQFSGSAGLDFSGSTISSGYSGGIGSWQYYQPNFNRLYAGQMDTYWPILSRMKNDQCNATSDFIIGIPPGGCMPSVVRSDLLADQSVPVFCELYAIKVNPLIKVSSIRSISFTGDYPDGVSGIAFHPARAAVKSYDTLLGDPLINNIGYVVIILKRERVEGDLAEWVAGNLTATIRYDADEAYGTGQSEYYLPVMSDDDWETDYARNAFWNGRGYLRVESVYEDTARIELLTSKDRVVRTFSLRVGETSALSYLPGYYCRAGLKVKLNSIVAPDDSALLNIDGQTIWVREGSKFLNGKCVVSKIDVEKDRVGSVSIRCPGNNNLKPLSLSESEGESLSDLGYTGGVDEYFEKSNDIVGELVKTYGSEMKETGEAFGEEALWEQIILAGELKKFKTQAELMDKFIEEYPSSKIVDQVRYRRQVLNGTDFSNSLVNVYVNNKFHSISVVDFKDVDESERKVDLKVAGGDIKSLSKGENFGIGDDKDMTISDILPGKVRISFKSSKEKEKSEVVWINNNEQYSFYGVDVYVRNIEVHEVAYIDLIPEVRHTKTEADFSFKIGIEKRGVELSPAKANEMIKNLNASIEKWEGIVEKLGNVVKGMKGACFATSTVLMLKNAVTGFSGASVARQKVMTKFKAICDTEHGEISRTQCYNELSSQIEGNVTAMTVALNSVNDKMDAAQAVGNNVGDSGGLFGGKSIINQSKYLESLRGQIGWESVKVNVSGKEVNVSLSEINSESELRAVLLYKQTAGQGVVNDVAKAEMEQSLRNTALSVEGNKEQFDLEKEFVFGSESFPVSILSEGMKAFPDKGKRIKLGDLSSIIGGVGLGLDIGDNEEVGAQIVHANSDNYLYVFDAKGAQLGVYEVSKAGNTLNVAKKVDALPRVSGVNVEMIQTGSCSNPWPQGKATVSYYESGDNKGLPAIVPFDLKNGWYAMIPNSGGTFLDDSPQGYTASADVRYFKICNIGSDRLMHSGQGDDLCQSFDANTVGDVGSFGGCSLSAAEVKKLYNDARQAIRQASEQSGKKVINILNQMMELGQPMSEVGGFECQDFMSPEECKLMFNVCDPVICPPSRCDFGGKMPVSDVIQTGIIGSLVLCLPNAAEGIIIPICLSGIHAGLDSYLSILRSERDCLERNLENGEMVGICDEITSIYKCEFFWRQLSPVMNQLLPSFVAGIIAPGERVRGGGEYALVGQAWNNVQQSISYFKDVYAQNAFRAFQLKNTEEVGSEICQAFVGTSVPASADLLDSLLEPESPTQFYAQFSENLFSEATVPSTSQYKVYYHIYAGNDKGVQYRVYLKNPPATSYYASNPSVWVDSGYIAKGSAADETVDFTAPSGYKELCVVIDAKEECGFKSVTTDFGLNYVKDKYVQEQAEASDITTEGECISGSPSALSMVDLNVQAGAEEVVNPEIAMRGIVRVCATQSPGTGVSDTRWKDVGYCGDSNMRCWLDVDSVKNDLGVIEAVEGTSIAILDERRGLIENEKMTLEEVRKVLASVSEKIKGLMDSDLKSPTEGKVVEILGELARIVSIDGDALAGTNADRAEALALKASVYRMVTMAKKEAGAGIVKPVPVASDVVVKKKEGVEGGGVKSYEEIVAENTYNEYVGEDFVLLKIRDDYYKIIYNGVYKGLNILLEDDGDGGIGKVVIAELDDLPLAGIYRDGQILIPMSFGDSGSSLKDYIEIKRSSLIDDGEIKEEDIEHTRWLYAGEKYWLQYDLGTLASFYRYDPVNIGIVDLCQLELTVHKGNSENSMEVGREYELSDIDGIGIHNEGCASIQDKCILSEYINSGKSEVDGTWGGLGFDASSLYNVFFVVNDKNKFRRMIGQIPWFETDALVRNAEVGDYVFYRTVGFGYIPKEDVKKFTVELVADEGGIKRLVISDGSVSSRVVSLSKDECGSKYGDDEKAEETVFLLGKIEVGNIIKKAGIQFKISAKRVSEDRVVFGLVLVEGWLSGGTLEGYVSDTLESKGYTFVEEERMNDIENDAELSVGSSEEVSVDVGGSDIEGKVVKVTYSEGANDYFYFRWNSSSNQIVVFAELNSILSKYISGWMGVAEFKEWVPFKSGSCIYSYERDEVLKVINSGSYNKMIEQIKGNEGKPYSDQVGKVDYVDNF